MARDQAAAARDRMAESKEAALAREGRSADPAIGALRKRAAEDRKRAAEGRRQARIDLRRARLDESTGVHARGLGQAGLQDEIDHARRSGEPFVLAFVDIDGLAEVDDGDGQPAGDVVPRTVAARRSRMIPAAVLGRTNVQTAVQAGITGYFECGKRLVRRMRARLLLGTRDRKELIEWK